MTCASVRRDGMSNVDERAVRPAPGWDLRDLLRFTEQSLAPAVAVHAVRLGWPVYAWRVVVPKPLDAPLDPLQRAILRLSVAGVTQSSELARCLGISPTLAAYIQRVCVQERLLDHGLRASDAA